MKTTRINMVKSYELSIAMTRPVYWFNDLFETGTWTDLHKHDAWGELIFVASGHIIVCTKYGNHLIPAHKMAWIPAGLEHEWYISGATHDRGLYIKPDILDPTLPHDRYRILQTSPLVRELILALENIPSDYTEIRDTRLIQTLLDQLSILQEADECITLPNDKRLLLMCTSLIENPEISSTLEEWAEELGMSERHLARQFKQQTGENFRIWRQHIRMQHAAEHLNTGQTVTDVAFSCGYASVSAFIVAFRKYFGATPGIHNTSNRIVKKI